MTAVAADTAAAILAERFALPASAGVQASCLPRVTSLLCQRACLCHLLAMLAWLTVCSATYPSFSLSARHFVNCSH